MTKFKVVFNNKIIEFQSRAQAENFALAHSISTNNISEVTETLNSDIAQQIAARIQYFQSVAPQLTRDLYVENTLAGITTAQSDQMDVR